MKIQIVRFMIEIDSALLPKFNTIAHPYKNKSWPTKHTKVSPSNLKG